MTTWSFEVQIYFKDIKTRPENPPLTRRFHPKMSTTNLPTLRWSGFTRQFDRQTEWRDDGERKRLPELEERLSHTYVKG